jgi:hypothetical protein
MGAWLVYHLTQSAGLAWPLAGLLGLVVSGLGMRWSHRPWRRVLIALGFPLSWSVWLLRAPTEATLTLSSSDARWNWMIERMDSAIWLLPVALLALFYPLRTWGDAPLFPTPRGALEGLPQALNLPDSALASLKVLDAGCGLGAGLREWRRVLPGAQLTGWEWSRPLRLMCAWRLPWATVSRRDIWAHSWAEFDVVYLFQRPESMPRAWAKACAEMTPGAWLISLEFEVPGHLPERVLAHGRSKPVWLYRLPQGQAGPGG